MLSPPKALSHYFAYDAWTSNAWHGHNFHPRDLKSSDVVPNTITIFKHNFKKNYENLITAGTVSLNGCNSKTSLNHTKIVAAVESALLYQFKVQGGKN